MLHFPITGTISTSQVLDRETTTHYWLTVYAQDHGLVPLYTRLEVYIEVKDTNDHIPMTFDTVYYGSVPENQNVDVILQVRAFDLDLNLNQSLRYAITRYNENNFFKINPVTGKRIFSLVHWRPDIILSSISLILRAANLYNTIKPEQAMLLSP